MDRGIRTPPHIVALLLRQREVVADGLRDCARAQIEQEGCQQAQHHGAGHAEPDRHLRQRMHAEETIRKQSDSHIAQCPCTPHGHLRQCMHAGLLRLLAPSNTNQRAT